MRLQISRSKNSASFYVIKTVYIDGKEKTIIVEKLGTYDQLLEKSDGQDPVEWAKKYVEELNKKEKEETREILVRYAPTKLISKDERHCFNGGYLFLQQIYHELKLHKLCKKIAQKYKFKFNLDSILLNRYMHNTWFYPLYRPSAHNKLHLS
jgi:hypothetical protein